MRRALQTLAASTLASAWAERWPQRLADAPGRLTGRPARVTLFLQPDDPDAWLLMAVLPRWLTAWNAQVTVRVVHAPDPAWLPEPEARAAWCWHDLRRSAPCWGVDVPADRPKPSLVHVAAQVLALTPEVSLERASEVMSALWAGDAAWLGAQPRATDEVTAVRHATNAVLRRGYGYGDGLQLGHAWYGGVDRLGALGDALDALGRRRSGCEPLRPDPRAARLPPPPDGPIRFFFSFRSPYSALAALRIFELGRRVGRPIDVRLVPPMVARGLPVPLAKRLHLYTDAAREGRRLGQPFGRTADPLDAWRDGVVLGLVAQQQGRLEAWLAAWSYDVWSGGVDVTTPAGLARVAAKAGIAVAGLAELRADPAVDKLLDSNRDELTALGLWGVPCMAVGDVALWGQDRLDVLEAWLSTAPVDASGGQAARVDEG